MTARPSLMGQYFAPPTERPFDDKSDLKVLDADNFASIAASLRKILQLSAQTSEEKFKILDERDKLYKIMKDKDSAFKRGALIATCPDMCPEKERLLRDYQGRGSMFEMSNYSKNSTFNHCLAVKEYARSSADQEEPLPHDLRPVSVLMMTMSHLLHNVVDYCELSDDNLEEWYMFMWDRTRALRKELTQQRLCNLESVTLVEQCARFHIHCAERLIDQDSSIYDDKINTENLTKCLQTLKYMYKDLAKEEIKCTNEPEFICYSLLLNLNNSSVFTELSDMSGALMTSEPVKFALDVMTTWETRNYIRFFNLVKRTTYLNCCLLRRYFGEMRLYAIKTMIRSYCTKTYSPQILISRFVEMLNFDGEDECLNFLSYCNFTFLDIDGRTAVNFDRIQFQNPNTTIPSGRAFLFIEEKKQRPLSVIMAGFSLPPQLYKDYVPQNSFTANGELDSELPPQKELIEFFLKVLPPLKAGLEFKNDFNRPTSVTVDIFSRPESTDTTDESKSQKKEETTGFSHSPLFSFKKDNPPSANLFGSFGKASESSNVFGKFNSATNATGNLFNSPGGNSFSKNIFGNQGASNLVNFNRNLSGNFDQKPFPLFNSNTGQEKPAGNPPVSLNNSGNLLMNFQPKVDLEAKLKEEREKMEKEKLERERIERERKEEEKRRREEEEKLRILEKKREEENRRRELERIERERREEEERRRREEIARRESEGRKRQEEKERQERLREANERALVELKRQEENKRRIELEHKRKVESKMKDLKTKMRKWKTKIIFDKWRVKTWTSIEGRKMKEYFKEVKLKYPPVCTEEMLNGNPHGLVIPSVLTLEKFKNWKKEFPQELSKKLLIVSDELPLLKIDSILGKILEDRARRIGYKWDPFYWKLVISVPDEMESPEHWKSIETFVEMHFVESTRWKFGIETGPLYCRSGSRGLFRFNVSIRRLRGCKLFEGLEPNPSATTGSNALIFFEDGSELFCNRLKTVLKSRHPLPKIPVVVISLSGKSEEGHLKKLLDLDAVVKSNVDKIQIVSVKDGKHLVTELIKCLRLAAVHCAPPSSLRIKKFSHYFSEMWLDSVWRRVEIGLSNYKIVLTEPKILIEFYNSCLEELEHIFLDKTHSEKTVLAPEFSDPNLIPPTRTSIYEEKLKKLLNALKLPHWPAETPKSCHQLNYRIHQYCKKVSGQEKLKTKNLKWILYRIIRQSLLWKGLDIYCDEDINKILINFPWILVFQEISRIITRQVCEKLKGKEDIVVTYDVNRIEEFSFESSFISKFFKKSKQVSVKKSVGEEEDEFDDLSPRVEKDSIVYAYTAAIERENNKRKREECYEESLDALFSSPAEKRLTMDEEMSSCDVSGIETNFLNLDSRLDEIKKRMAENFESLTKIYNELQ